MYLKKIIIISLLGMKLHIHKGKGFYKMWYRLYKKDMLHLTFICVKDVKWQNIFCLL